MGRLELPRIASLDPKSSASTNFATSACLNFSPQNYGDIFINANIFLVLMEKSLFLPLIMRSFLSFGDAYSLRFHGICICWSFLLRLRCWCWCIIHSINITFQLFICANIK